MKLNERIEAFAELGKCMRDTLEGRKTSRGSGLASVFESCHNLNPWFTPENARMAAGAIAEKLTEENLLRWTSRYPELNVEAEKLNAGVIMAGNIPLVGFHDLLSVLISGNRIIARISQKDAGLTEAIADLLCSINSSFRERIAFADGPLTGIDLVIATGSDNSSRYFEYYFGKYPNIIRKNRNSIAILTGEESDYELKELGKDVFSYFGLGCRNVSKIYIPEGFDMNRMINGWKGYSGIAGHTRYANNYDYNMAVYMVNREKFTDTGFLLLRESRSISSPVAVLYYEYYSSPEELRKETEMHSEKIQCIVSKQHTPFGSSQSPELWDYADNKDTIEFLLKKKLPGIM